MRLDFNGERVLAVVAHPDDAEFLCAGTLARVAHEGGTVGIAVLCQGDRGQSDPPIKHLASVRKHEMTDAAKLLGAQLFSSDVSDGSLQDSVEHRQILIDVFRTFIPTLVLAHAHNDYHSDHQAAAKLAFAASWFAASNGHPSAQPPLASPPALWEMDTVGMSGFDPAFFIDITQFLELKQQMLHCHKSQMARKDETNFAPLEPLMLNQSAARGLQAGVQAAEAFRWGGHWKRTRAF